jgi:hypothetical protein
MFSNLSDWQPQPDSHLMFTRHHNIRADPAEHSNKAEHTGGRECKAGKDWQGTGLDGSSEAPEIVYIDECEELRDSDAFNEEEPRGAFF